MDFDFYIYQLIVINSIYMRSLIYDLMLSASQKFVGPFYRSIGRPLYTLGTKIQGENASQDRLVPSLRNLSYSGSQPSLQGADFIAPNATILGKVQLGLNSSVWYGATLIGTKGITIGDNCVIQDRTHLSSQVKIGKNVFVGPNSIIQGSQLADNSFVSMGATVRHAKVESGGLVAAGAVIGDNIVVKQGEIWAGNPGKFLRNITPVERQVLREHLEQMRDLAIVHSEEADKTSREEISGQLQPFEMTIFENYLDSIYTLQEEPNSLPVTELDDDFVQRRTIMREVTEAPQMEKDYEPYQFNIAHMGQKFNLGVHKEAFNKVATKVVKKQRFDTDKNPWTKPF